MNLSKNKGQTTVFLCIVMLGAASLIGVLADAARISAGEAQIKRAVSLAEKSILARYSGTLKEDYGLFAYDSRNVTELESTIRRYMEMNLSADSSDGGIDLYDFRVDKVTVSPLFNLSENEAVRSSILEYMKYRAPQKIAEGFAERLDSVKQSGRMAGIYKRKISVDKLTGSMSKYLEKLKINIDGTLGDGKYIPYFISGFNKGGVRDAVVQSFAGMLDQLKEARKTAVDIQNLISEAQTGYEESEEKQEYIKSLVIQNKAILDRISFLQNNMAHILDSLKDDFTKPFIGPNIDAAKNIKKIAEYREKVVNALKILEEYIDLTASINNDSTIDTTVLSEIAGIKDLLTDGGKAEKLLSSVEKNAVVLKDSIAVIDKLSGMLNSGSILQIDGNQAVAMLNEISAGYSGNAGFSYKTAGNGKTGMDVRDRETVKSREVLTGNDDDISLKKLGIDRLELPSVKKILTGDSQGTGIFENEQQDALYNGSLENLGTEIDLKNEDAVFAENAFEFIEKIGEKLSGSLEGFRNEIYINEYIMGTFKNAVPALKERNGVQNAVDLHGDDLTGKKTVFNAEVEYILNGCDSENVNRIITKSKILLMRFVANTLHVYMDSQKRRLSETAAAAVCGWWSAGAAVPVVSHLIRCGWGLGEAVIDVTDLMEGKSVPFIKQKGDWKLDIGLNTDMDTKSDPRLALSYHDHLRIFLLLEDSDKKIGRIEDLVEINTSKQNPGFKAGSASTYIRVEAEVSMKYLFITGSLMPRKLKTSDGRHVFRVVLYDGY